MAGDLGDVVRLYFRTLVRDSELKQEVISGAIGKSQSWLSQYLSGKRGARVTFDDLDALANYFGRSLADVLVAVGRREVPRLSADDKWLALGRSLSARDRREFSRMIRGIVKAHGVNRARPRKPGGNSE